MRDVGLQLDYLNRLPEMKLSRFFGEAAGESTLARTEPRPRPPCTGQAYFLGRIIAIAAKGPQAEATAITHPWDADTSPPEDKELAPGPALNLGDLAFLIWTRDFLAALVSPVTLDTIRVTRAYRAGRMMEPVKLRGAEGPSDTAEDRHLFMARYGLEIAKRVRHFQVLAMFMLWFSLYLSVMVYSGQVLMTENTALQAAQAAHDVRIREATAQEQGLLQAKTHLQGDGLVSLFAPAYCEMRARPFDSKVEVVRIANASSNGNALSSPLGTAKEGAPDKVIIYVSDRQHELCVEHEDLKQRAQELKIRHGFWTEAASPVIAATTPMPGITYYARTVWRQLFHPKQRPTGWRQSLETHKFSMQQLINGLLAGIMPAVYAALGALASLFRRIAKKAEDEELGPSDHGGMMSSLVLGA